MVLGIVSAALGLAPVQRTALQPPRPQWETSTEALFQNVFGHRAHSWTVCSTNSTGTEQEIETGGARQEVSSANRQFTYSNPLWPNGLDWMRLPPGTHLLLYGRSSIAGISSALRAGSEAYGVLERSETVSAARDCADPGEDPRKHPQLTKCLYDCEAYMKVGPRELNVSTSADPHSVTVDYLAGGSTVTTISNHAQTQRLESRLDDWLGMVAPLNGSINFTHAVFMDPRPQWWFDQRCTGLYAEPREERAQGQEPRPRRQQQGQQLEERNEWNMTVEDCSPSADADCPRRHPLFRVVSRWVDRAPAVVLLPPRLFSRDIPFERGDDITRGTAPIGPLSGFPHESEFDPTADPPPASAYTPAPMDSGGDYLPEGTKPETYHVPEEFALRCVLDEQLNSWTPAGLPACPQGRNTTVWLAQTKLVYEFAGAAQDANPPCYCEHVCNARCVVDPDASSSSGPNCYVGPGVAATWLVLRASGLA